MKQKLLVVLSVFLLVLIPSILGGFLKLTREKKDSLNPSPSPSPIRYLGWPEYRNDTHRYKLKYPYDWIILSSTSPDEITFINIKLEEYPNKPHVSFKIKAENFSGDPSDHPEVVNLTAKGYVARKLTISRSPALFIDNLGDTGELSNTYIQHKDNIFRLSWEETEIGLIRPHEDTLLQIIASFEFLD